MKIFRQVGRLGVALCGAPELSLRRAGVLESWNNGKEISGCDGVEC